MCSAEVLAGFFFGSGRWEGWIGLNVISLSLSLSLLCLLSLLSTFYSLLSLHFDSQFYKRLASMLVFILAANRVWLGW